MNVFTITERDHTGKRWEWSHLANCDSVKTGAMYVSQRVYHTPRSPIIEVIENARPLDKFTGEYPFAIRHENSSVTVMISKDLIFEIAKTKVWNEGDFS